MQKIGFLNNSQGEKDSFQLFTGLQCDPLPTRLVREARQNYQDFRQNPKGFIHALFFLTRREGQRLQLLMWCMGFAVLAFSTTFMVFFLIPRMVKGDESKVESTTQLFLQTPLALPLANPEASKQGGGSGLKEFRDRKSGLGGGGAAGRDQTPATKGRFPQASPTAEQIVSPSVHNPIESPSLPVPTFVKADPSLMPKQDLKLPFGLQDGANGNLSDGMGNKGGIGNNGNGGSIGNDNGRGAGPGNLAGVGGGFPGGPGHGPGPGDGTGGGGNLRPTIISQTKPKYTEEARQNKRIGKVVLSVEFRADGTIGDIRVVQSLGFGLDENAIAAARQIRFRPAMSGGLPVGSRARVEYSFNLI